MILVLGGTTEGRVAVRVLDEAGKPFYYSTRGNLQQIQSRHAQLVSGGMDETEMSTFCRDNEIRLLVDAAHPFASALHHTVSRVSMALDIPVIRLERQYPPRDTDIVWCDDYKDAIVKLRSHNIRRLLALTGVQTIGRLAGYWRMDGTETWFRILDRVQSRDIAAREDFPSERLLYYHDDGDCTEEIERLHPDAIITKESGESGGFETKITAARQHGIKVFAIKRPPLPGHFITVTGEHGLRREVERLLPGFYPLRTGFTTGACATATSKAALTALLTGDDGISDISFTLPDGEIMRMPVERVEILSPISARASVIKDAGDDPDVTHGRMITVTVEFSDHDCIRFIGGEGVGTVTLPGLGIEPGEPAINPVPRHMMTSELSALYTGGLDVTISVPGGEELALKTFNPRIGIVGGISIIGTSGIVRPFSNEAFIESIRREMEVAQAIGADRIVVNSGAKSERFVRALYPALPDQAFIHYGNAIGETMRLAAELDVRRLTIGLMIGKAVKLAEGNLDTHSHKVTLNREFLQSVARAAGCSQDAIDTIATLNLARELWESLSPHDAALFFPRLLRLCHDTCRQLYTPTHGILESLLISDNGEIPYRIQ
ncbi:MAG: cobalt-precorrin-5B (C(1))-methyltransferase CbiD [Duncaniella sp.]|nr:cobalt-precorrin-5B (C(1))-methyltransferase CbiD [Duncaniella sp.]